MFDKLSTNLNLLMAKARINSSELARKTGVPASTIKKIRKQANANPTLTTLIPIAQNFSLSVSQLIGDDANVHLEQAASHYLPLLTWQEAALWPDNAGATANFTTIKNSFGAQTFGLLTPNEHWEGFLQNAIMIIDGAQQPLHRDYVIVSHDHHLPVLRQYLIDDGIIYLKPVVNGYQMSLLTDRHRIIGTVIEQRQLLKQI